MVVCLIVPPGPVREFRIDAGHSEVGFSIGFLGHPVHGRFDDVRGTITYAEGSPAANGVAVVIAAPSVSTGSAHRDEHLRSPDFFDVSRYPVITFHSTGIVARGKEFVATGPLTMHGITRTVAIAFEQTQPLLADPHGTDLVFFSGTLRLARKDFGILGGSRYNSWFDELRSATMADSVDITLEITGYDHVPARIPRYTDELERIDAGGIAAVLMRIHSIGADTLRSQAWDIEEVARLLQSRGRSADGLALLEAMTARLDGDATMHAALARAYEVAGKPELAVEQTRRALALDSLDTRAIELERRLRPRPTPR